MTYHRKIEHMIAKRLERSTSSPNPDAHDVLPSTSGDRDAVASTSGINTRLASSSSNIRMNDSILNTSTSFDEQDFGTQNKDHLETELQVEICGYSSYETLPELQLIVKEDPTSNEQIEEETMVTTFRAINEDDKAKRRRSRRDKFIKFDARSSCSDSE